MICAHPPGLDVSLISCHSWASSPGEVARAVPPRTAHANGALATSIAHGLCCRRLPRCYGLLHAQSWLPAWKGFSRLRESPAGAAVPVRWSQCGGPSAEPGERYLEGERLPSALSLPALAARATTTKARVVTREPCARADRGNAARYFTESISCSSVASGTGLAGRRSAECHNSNAPNITSSPLFCASQCSELRGTRLGHGAEEGPCLENEGSVAHSSSQPWSAPPAQGLAPIGDGHQEHCSPHPIPASPRSAAVIET